MFIKLKNNDVLVINDLKDFHNLVYEHLGYEASECLDILIRNELEEYSENMSYEVSETTYRAISYLGETKRINREKIIQTLESIVDLTEISETK